jgi:hypothetical protein
MSLFVVQFLSNWHEFNTKDYFAAGTAPMSEWVEMVVFLSTWFR